MLKQEPVEVPSASTMAPLAASASVKFRPSARDRVYAIGEGASVFLLPIVASPVMRLLSGKASGPEEWMFYIVLLASHWLLLPVHGRFRANDEGFAFTFCGWVTFRGLWNSVESVIYAEEKGIWSIHLANGKSKSLPRLNRVGIFRELLRHVPREKWRSEAARPSVSKVVVAPKRHANKASHLTQSVWLGGILLLILTVGVVVRSFRFGGPEEAGWAFLWMLPFLAVGIRQLWPMYRRSKSETVEIDSDGISFKSERQHHRVEWRKLRLVDQSFDENKHSKSFLLADDRDVVEIETSRLLIPEIRSSVIEHAPSDAIIHGFQSKLKD